MKSRTCYLKARLLQRPLLHIDDKPVTCIDNRGKNHMSDIQIMLFSMALLDATERSGEEIRAMASRIFEKPVESSMINVSLNRLRAGLKEHDLTIETVRGVKPNTYRYQLKDLKL